MKKSLKDLRAEDHANELTRILLIDDHVSYRQALANMLERQPEFKVVGEAGSLAEARKLSGKSLKDVDVAVVDLALPDGDTFGLIERFALNEPQVMILVLSASLEPERITRAVEAGAAGVLDKFTPIKDIIEALRQLKDGEALISRPEVIEMLSREGQHKQEALQAIETLSSREREILRALAEGLEDKEIAEKLNIAPNTVRHHIKAILYKLGVHSRLQALLFAVRHGLVEIR